MKEIILPTSMKGIFSDLNIGRKESETEHHMFGVYPLTKKGTPIKKPSSTFRTEWEAIATAKEMEILNNKIFIVKRL